MLLHHIVSAFFISSSPTLTLVPFIKSWPTLLSISGSDFSLAPSCLYQHLQIWIVSIFCFFFHFLMPTLVHFSVLTWPLCTAVGSVHISSNISSRSILLHFLHMCTTTQGLFCCIRTWKHRECSIGRVLRKTPWYKPGKSHQLNLLCHPRGVNCIFHLFSSGAGDEICNIAWAKVVLKDEILKIAIVDAQKSSVDKEVGQKSGYNYYLVQCVQSIQQMTEDPHI